MSALCSQRIIVIFLSIGLYVVAPTPLLASIFIMKEEDSKNRKVLIIPIPFILFWILLSSLRAGGNQWDNPLFPAVVPQPIL